LAWHDASLDAGLDYKENLGATQGALRRARQCLRSRRRDGGRAGRLALRWIETLWSHEPRNMEPLALRRRLHEW